MGAKMDDARWKTINNEIGKLAACSLISISLANAGLMDSDLEKIAGLTQLELVWVENNVGITDAGFEHFEKIASLRILDITGTSVTKEGVEKFQKKHPDVKVHFE